MANFKLGTIGAVLNAMQNPRAIAITDKKIGQVYKIVDNYSATIKEGAVAFATDAEVKAGKAYVCLNIIDTAELWTSGDFVVKAGSPVRSYLLDSILGYPVEISSDLVKTAFATVVVGDVLVPCNVAEDATTPTSWKVPTTQTGYAIGIKVLEKTTFGGTGFYGKFVTV